jgi:hypothetical protein
LKEGARVCGGCGQFGKEPLWDLNTIPDFRTECGNDDSCNSEGVGEWLKQEKLGIDTGLVSG